MSRTLKLMNQHVDVMLEQCDDINLLIEYDDLKEFIPKFRNNVLLNMYRTSYLNFKQRQRFIAVTYAKNSLDAMNRLYVVELC